MKIDRVQSIPQTWMFGELKSGDVFRYASPVEVENVYMKIDEPSIRGGMAVMMKNGRRYEVRGDKSVILQDARLNVADR